VSKRETHMHYTVKSRTNLSINVYYMRFTYKSSTGEEIY
jgi:hypothetical protein